MPHDIHVDHAAGELLLRLADQRRAPDPYNPAAPVELVDELLCIAPVHGRGSSEKADHAGFREGRRRLQRGDYSNNRDIKNEKRWTPFVSWGKVASAFGVDLHTANIAQYGDNLKRRGVRDDERRAMKMARIVEVYRSSGQNGGMMVHFNSSGRLNGSGTHRHAVVLVGYIERGGEIVDLLVNDSSVAAPAGACVRMSESSLPLSIIGARKLKKAEDKGEDIAMILMDYAVSCRWATLDDKQ